MGYHKGDVEVITDKSKSPLWTKEQAARWIAEIKELLKPSTAPFRWFDEGVPADDEREGMYHALISADAEFKEEEHTRGEGGKFTNAAPSKPGTAAQAKTFDPKASIRSDMEAWYLEGLRIVKSHGVMPGRVPEMQARLGTVEMIARCVRRSEYDLSKLNRLGLMEWSFEAGLIRFAPLFESYPDYQDLRDIAEFKLANPDLFN